jgi:hypothetical protein
MQSQTSSFEWDTRRVLNAPDVCPLLKLGVDVRDFFLHGQIQG